MTSFRGVILLLSQLRGGDGEEGQGLPEPYLPSSGLLEPLYTWSPIPTLHPVGNCLGFLLGVSASRFSCLGLPFTLSQFVCKVPGTDQIPFSYLWTSRFPCTDCWRCFSPLHNMFFVSLSNKGWGYICSCLCLRLVPLIYTFSLSQYSVCKDFVECFRVYVALWYWTVVFLCVSVVSGSFWVVESSWLHGRSLGVFLLFPLFFLIWTVREGLACRSSLNSVENPSVLGHVLSGKPFYYYFCLFICYGSV